MNLPITPVTVSVVMDPECGVPNVFADRADADRYAARAIGELEVSEADVVDRQAAAALIADHHDENET